MATGKVKWFDEKKGYGFIVEDDSQQDYFVHFSGISSEGFRTLEEGAPVEFEIDDQGNKPAAVNVKVVQS